MIEFKWIITDKYIGRKGDENYGTDDFPYADGWFEMTLNRTKWGAFPPVAESWNHSFVKNIPPAGDCLTELFQCFVRVLNLKPFQSFVFEPMDLPLINLVFSRETDVLQISQQWNEAEISRIQLKNPGWSPPDRWTESVSFEEFCREVKENFIQFVVVISHENPEILNNKYVENLIIDFFGTNPKISE